MKTSEIVGRLKHDERKLYAIARAMMGNEHDALDMLSETSYLACRKAGTIRSEDSVSCWLATVMVNCCRTALRKRRPTVLIDPETLPAPDETGAFDVREMVERLPDEYRAIVVLRFYGDMRAPEIARRLKLPESTVRHRLNRALTLLRM